jgi:hypothetical protein
MVILTWSPVCSWILCALKWASFGGYRDGKNIFVLDGKFPLLDGIF